MLFSLFRMCSTISTWIETTSLKIFFTYLVCLFFPSTVRPDLGFTLAVYFGVGRCETCKAFSVTINLFHSADAEMSFPNVRDTVPACLIVLQTANKNRDTSVDNSHPFHHTLSKQPATECLCQSSPGMAIRAMTGPQARLGWENGEVTFTYWIGKKWLLCVYGHFVFTSPANDLIVSKHLESQFRLCASLLH